MTTARPPVDFVVVGAQRAASTHLTSCLRDHPQVRMCGDEVPFFESPFFEHSSVAELDRIFAGARPGERRGIQRPDYLGREECPGNIHALAPDARILAVLRDPVARAVSAYFWYMQFGLLPLAPLDVGMARLLDGWTDPAHPRAPEILEFGRYGHHLGRYVEKFGRGQVTAVLDEDLRDDATFARLYEFVGVDPAHRPRPPQARTNAGAYDLRRLRVLRARRRFAWSWDGVTEYTYRSRRGRRPVASAAAAAVVTFDRLVLARLLRSSPPRLDPGLERTLRDWYRDDLRSLEDLLGRPLPQWRGDGVPGTTAAAHPAQDQGPGSATR